jgi:hypothetical protein
VPPHLNRTGGGGREPPAGAAVFRMILCESG